MPGTGSTTTSAATDGTSTPAAGPLRAGSTPDPKGTSAQSADNLDVVGRAAHRRGFALVAIAFAIGMAYSTVPTPLYPLYAQRDGFGTTIVTVVFAAYAIGVLLSLFLIGHLSDVLGRRRILVPGLLVEALSAVVFLVAPSLPGLLVARVLCGVGVGMITATATAHLAELHGRGRPGRPRTLADLVATGANLGGLALGPLIAGVLAQFVSGPLVVPYWIFLAALLVMAALLSLAPETVQRERRPYRPQHVSVPPAGRRSYVTAAAVAFVAFALMGLFTGLSSAFVSGTLHHTSHLLAGIPAFAVFGASAIAQALSGRAAPRRQMLLGMLLLVAGLVATTVGVWTVDLALFLVGGTVAGAGVGLMFKGALSTAAGLAPARTRSEVMAGIFLAAYLGLTVPVVGVGLLTRVTTTPWALTGFAVLMTIAAAALSLRIARRTAD